MNSCGALLLVTMAQTTMPASPAAVIVSAPTRFDLLDRADLDRRSDSLQRSLDERHQALRARLRTLYRLSRHGAFSLWQHAGSGQDLAMSSRLFRNLVARDLEEIEVLQKEARDLDREAARTVAVDAKTGVVALALAPPVVGELIAHFGRFEESGLTLFRPFVLLRSDVGEPVLASGAGEVIWVGLVPQVGPSVVIDHDAGVQSLVGPLSFLRAKLHQHVTRATMLGVAKAPTLLFEVVAAGLPIDPQKLQTVTTLK